MSRCGLLFNDWALPALAMRCKIDTMNFSHGRPRSHRALRSAIPAVLLVLLPSLILNFSFPIAFAQVPSEKLESAIVLTGTVRNASGELVGSASVFLEEKGGARLVRTRANEDGSFVFSLNKGGTYSLRAEKDGLRSAAIGLLVLK